MGGFECGMLRNPVVHHFLILCQMFFPGQTLGIFVSRWVDLKILYKRHYRKEAKGGLQACVERLGLTFQGRAHDGLIDSRNTAAIATR